MSKNQKLPLTEKVKDELKKGATQKELNTYLDDIIARANESDSNFINLTVEGASFIMQKFDSTDERTKKFDTQLFTAEILNQEKKLWELKKFTCPKALVTRFDNLKKMLKNDFSEHQYLVKYNGMVKSTKSANMIHSFFVKDLSVTDSE